MATLSSSQFSLSGLWHAPSHRSLGSNRDTSGVGLSNPLSSALAYKPSSGWLGRSSQAATRWSNAPQVSWGDAQASSQRFSTTSGYGLVNAAAAVGRVLRDRLLQRSSRGQQRQVTGDRYLWGLDRLRVAPVWEKGITGRNVVVAVLDSGVDYTHRDLRRNIWRNPGEIAGNGRDDDGNGYVDDVRGWDFAYGSNWVMDYDGHGTHVAGTIAAVKNGNGVTGVAYNAKIMPVKVLDNTGAGYNSDIAAGVRYAVNNGADVINISIQGSYSYQVERAVRYAHTRGVTVVMSSGNDGTLVPSYPAALATRWGIAVGAVSSRLTVADFSNRAGFRMDYVVAPGVNIWSTVPGNRFSSYEGTSMAAPHVAGVAALMLSANPNLKPAQVETILTSTATLVD